VSLGQSFGNLAGDGDGLPDRQISQPMDNALEVFPPPIFHGDKELFPLFAQVKHPADIGVANFAGDLDLIPEALDGPLLDRDLGPNQLEGHFLIDLLIEGTKNPTHAPAAELFDDFIPAGKQRPTGQFIRCYFERPNNADFNAL